MAPSTPVQQKYLGTRDLSVDTDPATIAYPIGALADDLVLVHTGTEVSLYRLSSSGAEWLDAAGDWEARPSHVAAMDDMVVTVKEKSGSEDFHLFTPGTPWTVQSCSPIGYEGGGLCISGDQAEVICEYGGAVRAYSTAVFDGTLEWICLTGDGWLVASPRAGRWLRYDGSDIALMDDTGASLDTLTWAPDHGDAFDAGVTWVTLAEDSHAVLYVHVVTGGSWPKPAVIRYRVLTTTGDTIGWADDEQEIDAGWEAMVLDSVNVTASSWFGQVAVAYSRGENL